MEGRDWVESLGGLEVAAAQQKDQLIARRAQARRDVLDGVGKSKQRLRSTLLKIGGKSNTSRSTLLRIFMRGMGGSLSLRGSHFSWQAKRVARTRFRKIAKGGVECTREYRNESQKGRKAG